MGAAGVVGLVLLVVLTVAFVRRPGWFVIAVVLTLPFRIPVPTGADDTANLLLPLYGVLAAGVLAHLWRVFRTRRGVRRARTRARGACWSRWRSWSCSTRRSRSTRSDISSTRSRRSASSTCRSRSLMRLLVELRWSRRLVLQVLGRGGGARAAVRGGRLRRVRRPGRLLISNEKVLAANDLKPYFRVNSLFFDPNIYGRFLALAMMRWPACCCGRRAARRRRAWRVALALLWAALVLSLSESSFAALLVGLRGAGGAAVAARSPVLAVCGAGDR